MAKSRERLPAILYRRVSTERQGRTGIGLPAQTVAVKAYAEQEGYTIIAEYQDVCTGKGEESAYERSGLQAAIAEAACKKVPILVYDFDRFSRHTSSAEEIVQTTNVIVISTRTGERGSPSTIASRVAYAQEVGERISINTKNGMARSKDEGAVFGNPNISEAQKRGVEARQLQARKRVEVIETVLQEFPEKLTHQELADILNQRNIPTAFGKLWTAKSIRRPRRDAERLLQEKAKAQKQEDEHYKNHPLYGRF
ncbi:resolvase [Nitratireductor aestuarii]|uniref:Resolvase n=1 Tax=Nitratireductor aestuarii TaxID=1735103 RepID=A0A916S3Q7_9HYPH|nr:recombinase family protein [Nitratireductor aestuarii]GGA82945.1 resolvase [Nitratireductor aestuarii]